MPHYAQTYLQLFNQLQELDYGSEDRRTVRDAYELAMELFTGRFQPSGKVFMAHVVGTASILASLRLPAQVVAAGLLHNVYNSGDFGDIEFGVTNARRETISRSLGPAVEELVARFPQCYWESPKAESACRAPEQLDEVDKNVFWILIADHLEHLGDLDLFYYSDRVRKTFLTHCKLAAEVSTRFGIPSLSEELRKGIQLTEQAEPVTNPSREPLVDTSFVVTSKSLRKRVALTIRQAVNRHRTRLRKGVSWRVKGYWKSTTKMKASVGRRLRKAGAVIGSVSRRSRRIRANSALFEALVGKGDCLERVATGFQFTEGPVWIPEDRVLLFSDIPKNRIVRLESDGMVVTFRSPSGNSNGLTLDKKGRLIVCEHGTRQVTRTEEDGSITVLADVFDGKKLNSPNDVVVKSDGAIYFTDPTYGIEAEQQEQPVEGVYRLSPDGKDLSLISGDFARPNGLAFSPDEKTLYVDDSYRRHIRVFSVQNDGFLSGGTILHDMNVEIPGSPDGMKVDVEGHIFCTGAGGVWVFDKTGNHLGTIVTPEKPSNCAWGDQDWQTLYITAVTSIYKIRVAVPGIPHF